MRKINSQLPVAAGRVLLRHLEAHFPAISLIPFPSVPLSSLRRRHAVIGRMSACAPMDQISGY